MGVTSVLRVATAALGVAVENRTVRINGPAPVGDIPEITHQIEQGDIPQLQALHLVGFRRIHQRRQCGFGRRRFREPGHESMCHPQLLQAFADVRENHLGLHVLVVDSRNDLPFEKIHGLLSPWRETVFDFPGRWGVLIVTIWRRIQGKIRQAGEGHRFETQGTLAEEEEILGLAVVDHFHLRAGTHSAPDAKSIGHDERNLSHRLAVDGRVLARKAGRLAARIVGVEAVELAFHHMTRLACRFFAGFFHRHHRANLSGVEADLELEIAVVVRVMEIGPLGASPGSRHNIQLGVGLAKRPRYLFWSAARIKAFRPLLQLRHSSQLFHTIPGILLGFLDPIPGLRRLVLPHLLFPFPGFGGLLLGLFTGRRPKLRGADDKCGDDGTDWEQLGSVRSHC